MKLAFTTLGCPDWDLEKIIAVAKEAGFDGVDFRGYQGEMAVFKLPQFSARASETAQRFADAGLEVPCFSSSARLMPKEQGSVEAMVEEVRAYAALCAVFRAKFIRVFGGAIGELGWDAAIEKAAQVLQRMGDSAAEHGVKVLVETHDAWVDSNHVKALMEATDSDAVGVLWDIHHPWRKSGETPEQTWSLIGPWILNTHWKDAMAGETGALCAIGAGEMPLADFYKVLDAGGYDGYYTLEWEKKWHPELDDADVAFPAYVEFMNKLEEEHAA